MSVNYAAGLSSYDDKGKLGLPEIFDSQAEIEAKVNILGTWIIQSKHLVVHTGAGVSTAAGIPDFRGPNGVWTLESKGKSPEMSVTFDEAIPTYTHMALVTLESLNILKYLITQNVDGLHMRSGFPCNRLSELHGNVFLEECVNCHRRYVRENAVSSVGQKFTGKHCQASKNGRQPCKGKLRDSVLDWEAALPEEELAVAEQESQNADLSVCLGTTLQIIPAGNLPLLTRKAGGKMVIVNLQETKHDKHADLIIHARVDDVIRLLMNRLNANVCSYEGPKIIYSSFSRQRFVYKKRMLPVRPPQSRPERKRPQVDVNVSSKKHASKRKSTTIDEKTVSASSQSSIDDDDDDDNRCLSYYVKLRRPEHVVKDKTHEDSDECTELEKQNFNGRPRRSSLVSKKEDDTKYKPAIFDLDNNKGVVRLTFNNLTSRSSFNGDNAKGKKASHTDSKTVKNVVRESDHVSGNSSFTDQSFIVLPD